MIDDRLTGLDCSFNNIKQSNSVMSFILNIDFQHLEKIKFFNHIHYVIEVLILSILL